MVRSGKRRNVSSVANGGTAHSNIKGAERVTPLQIIADWLWSESDQIDFDDMGAEAAMQIVAKLDAAGYKIVRKDMTEQMLERVKQINR